MTPAAQDPQVEAAPAESPQTTTPPASSAPAQPPPGAPTEPASGAPSEPGPGTPAEPAPGIPVDPAAAPEPIVTVSPGSHEPEPRTIDADLGGYGELRLTGMLGVTGNPLGFAERVRPKFDIAPIDGPMAGRLKAEVVVEAALTQGRDTGKELSDTIFASDLGPLLTAANCTYAPEPLFATIASALSVERLHVDFNLKHVDLKVGRQAIRWGSGLYFHPTDLYAEVLLTEPWKEPAGINAIKADVPIGGSDITAVVAMGDDLSSLYTVAQGTADKIVARDVPLSAAVKGTLRVGGVDVAAVGQARADQNWFVGGDVRGTLGVGYWAEGGWHGAVSTPAIDTKGYVEVVGGIDYSFPVLNMLYLAAEYRYDGSGAAPGNYDYTSRLSGSLPFDCAMLPSTSGTATRFTLGRHYLDGVVRLGITEEWGVTAGGLVNLADGTGELIPAVSWTATDRVVINASGQIPVGKDGEFRPAPSSLTYTLGTSSVDLSGLVPDATFTGWVRYSF